MVGRFSCIYKCEAMPNAIGDGSTTAQMLFKPPRPHFCFTEFPGFISTPATPAAFLAHEHTADLVLRGGHS